MNNNKELLTIYKMDDNEIRYIVEFNYEPNIRIAIMNGCLSQIKEFIKDVYLIKENNTGNSISLFVGSFFQDAIYTIKIIYDNNDGLIGYLYENDEDENFINKIQIEQIVINEFINKFKAIINMEDITI